MLEWYTVDADYRSQADLTTELLHVLAEELTHADASFAASAPPERLPVTEALTRYAGTPPDLFSRAGGIREAAYELDMLVRPDESEEDLFQRLLLTYVEPELPPDRPVFLTDYPALVPTLARTRETVAERWELYLAGMELANCYTEERDPEALARFLETEGRRKQDALVPHPCAHSLMEFAQAPPSSGVALGVDRLIMALLGRREIGGVIFFP